MHSRPFWPNLPFSFKRNVVDKLDFKSRIALQRCSKSDRSIVNTVPFFMNSILLNLSPEPYEAMGPGSSSDEESDISDVSSDGGKDIPLVYLPKAELLVSEKPFTKGLYWKTENEDVTIDALKLILQSFGFYEMNFSKDGNPSRFIKKLLEELDETKRFHVEKLTWTCIDIAKNQEEMEKALQFFGCFDSGTLKTLEINFSNQELIQEMMNMDQFQNLQEIFINSEIDSDQLMNLFHARRFKVKLSEVTVKHLRTVIEVFLTKNLGSYFKISTDECQIELDSLLKMFETMPNNCSVPTDSFYERDTNTHRFEILNHKTVNGEHLVLFLKIRRNDLWGVVCRTNFIIKDFAVCPYY